MEGKRVKLVGHRWSVGPSSCPGRPGCLSSRQESHPVPGGFPSNVVLQRGEEVSHFGKTEADGESGKSGAAMLKVSSSLVMKSSLSSLLLHSLVYLFFRVSIFFKTLKSFIDAAYWPHFNRRAKTEK